MAFSLEERQSLGIQGLLPPRIKTQEEQVHLCKLSLERYSDDLSKYVYLMGLLVSPDKSDVQVLNCRFPAGS